MRNLVILGVFLLSLVWATQTVWAEDGGLPVLEEHVDEIWVIRTDGNDYGRVVFIRYAENGSDVLATRLLLDEMVWAVNEKAEIQLMWRDYWTAERIVTTDSFATVIQPYDPTQVNQRGQWWCQNRNMNDLKQPD